MKVMLATNADLDQIRFPVIVSPKLDGIRAVVVDGVVMSRNMKPIPNRHVQRLFGYQKLNGLDGELIVGPANAPDVFRTTTSGVMAEDGEPDVSFCIFDRVGEGTYRKRFEPRLYANQLGIKVVHSYIARDLDELLKLEAGFVAEGYEGAMVRDPEGPYKHGRSTAKEGYLLKLKRFEDSEARVLGYECQFRNENEAKRNGAGRLERSTHKDGKVATNKLGTLFVKDIHTGVKFNIGTGFTDAERKDLWRDHDSLLGKIVKYRYFPTGAKEKPRFPTFLGFRDRRDLLREELAFALAPEKQEP